MHVAQYRFPRAASSQECSAFLAPSVVPECENPVARSDRKYCSDACLRAYWKDVNLPRLSTAGIRRLATLRSSGVDPAHGGEVERKRAATQRRHDNGRMEWEKLGLDIDAEKARFLREIQPGLSAVSVRRIARVAGIPPETPHLCGGAWLSRTPCTIRRWRCWLVAGKE